MQNLNAASLILITPLLCIEDIASRRGSFIKIRRTSLKYLLLPLLFIHFWRMGLQAQEEWPEAIADNSFLIEEAYNQSPRVVQHIFNLMISRPAHDIDLSLTQEWPVISQRHQLSFTLPYAWLNKNSVHGLGDIVINYRYQLTGEDQWAVTAPRLSVIIPSGDEKKELGTGKTGFEFNLPVSKRLSAQWIIHANAGATYTPGVKFGTEKKNLKGYHAGASVIWLWKSNFNVMLEWLSTFDDEMNSAGKMKIKPTHIINPGIRYAQNFGDLQVVPGLSVPLQVNGKDKMRALFLYLSFEHPF